jgi:peptidoglycan/LPS O-acetylase OafA/YrhL
MSSAKFYRPELDALRFLAFSLVFVYHTAASIKAQMFASGAIQSAIARTVTAGGYGVDIFFLLSAYLITELLMREKARVGTVDAVAFYVRRALRIWPLYYFFLIFTLVGSHFTPMQFPSGAILPMFLFYGNFWFMTHPFFSPASLLWSVSIEEQFYVVWPFAVRRFSRQGLIILSCVLLLVSSAARFALMKSGLFDGNALWVCTFTRLDPIATGMLACLLLRGRFPAVSLLPRLALLLAGGLSLYGAANWLDGTDRNLSLAEGMSAYPLADLGALAIFLSFLGARITWRPLIYLGQISYGLYVYHILALDVAKVALLHFTGTCPFWLRAGIGFPLTVALAALSYKVLEAPFLTLKGKSVMLLPPGWALAGFRRK